MWGLLQKTISRACRGSLLIEEILVLGRTMLSSLPQQGFGLRFGLSVLRGEELGGASGAARPAPGGLWGWRHACLWQAESKRCHFALQSERCRFALRPRSPVLGRWQPQPGPGLPATRAPAARPRAAPAKPSSPGLAGKVLAQPPSRPLSSPLRSRFFPSEGEPEGFLLGLESNGGC